MRELPSIFNDVIGPVMRGPSSSHTAASWRIAQLGLSLLNEPLKKALIEFDSAGQWHTNYREQGTTLGIEGGLLNLGISDERIRDTQKYAKEKGVSFTYKVSSFLTTHVNSVRLTLWSTSQKQLQIIGVSLGGGAFEIRSIDGFDVLLNGKNYEIICFSKSNGLENINSTNSDKVGFRFQEKEAGTVFQFKSSQPFSEDLIEELNNHSEINSVAVVKPIMPIIAGNDSETPFSSIASLVQFSEEHDLNLGQLGLHYEKCISGLSEEELVQRMEDLIQIVNCAIDVGLRGTHYADRILHQQSHLIEEKEAQGKLKSSVVNRIIERVSALMESKSAMEVIVAIPTAGSCGTVGGSLSAVGEFLESSKDEIISAYFAAGLIGVYFARGPGFSAEEHGCQVETGASGAMAAAALAQLMRGTAKQALDAASMALQNSIGLICDPVADRVEVPCLGKNISAAVNGYTTATMSVAGFNAVIPLDQVIQTVAQVSKSMPSCVKCTGEGGLAVTKTAIELKKKLIRN
ncbi:MAG: serine dehydratase [Gammaproteobacteria bacterium]|nr:serine dehydratase [Gammaproteobacteria bacterium]